MKNESIEQLKEFADIEEVARTFVDRYDVESGTEFERVLDYLQKHQEDVDEFCLQIHDRYGEKDSTTPVLIISTLIKKLLEEREKSHNASA